MENGLYYFVLHATIILTANILHSNNVVDFIITVYWAVAGAMALLSLDGRGYVILQDKGEV